ncbi:MAG: protoheme IX farnesyltransferase [Bacteroidales bacterium]|nr:protoheme IX farnesyltransferase [Bacteroidales bacterium]
MIKKHLELFLALGKVRITFAVTLSTLTGYLLYARSFTADLIYPLVGVFFLSAASAALNQWQERKYDAMMQRTATRPIPTGTVSKAYVFSYIFILWLAGSLILYVQSGLTPMLLGWLTFFWYNAIYTPMKRRSVFAVIAGALIGALPPMIGYTAAGGAWYQTEILIVAFFFFIWQVPHFILLVLRLGEQYEAAGYPTLTQYFNETQLKGIVFSWITGTVFTAFLLPVFHIINNPFITGALLLFSIALMVMSRSLISTVLQFRFRSLFLNINLYLLVIMILIVLETQV